MFVSLKSALVAACATLSLASGANALTIDTTTGTSISSGYGQLGQSITVGSVENYLDNIGFVLSGDTSGETFTLTIADALNGGNTLFTSDFTAQDGLNTVNTGLDLSGVGSILAFLNFNGYTGKAVGFISDSYNGGAFLYLSSGSWQTYSSYDLRFKANFTSPPAPAVPLPAALPLLLAGLGGLGLMARRKRA